MLTSGFNLFAIFFMQLWGWNPERRGVVAGSPSGFDVSAGEGGGLLSTTALEGWTTKRASQIARFLRWGCPLGAIF